MSSMGLSVPLHLAFAFNNPSFSDRILHIEIGNGENHDGQDVHVNSLVLAAQSDFFEKLFTTDMKESKHSNVKLHVDNDSEAQGVMDLVKFMYVGDIQPIDPLELLHLLVAGDKFGVASCVTQCVKKLIVQPMTLELAKTFFDQLPTSKGVEALRSKSENFLLNNIKKKEDFVDLSTLAIEFLLTSDKFRVDTEYDAYLMLRAWAETTYPSMQERRCMLDKLIPYIRFPMMSTSELKTVLNTSNGEYDCTSYIMEALFFKSELSVGRADSGLELEHRRCIPRAYGTRTPTVVEFHQPCYHVVVFLHFTEDEISMHDKLHQECHKEIKYGKQTFRCSLWKYRDEPYLLVHIQIGKYNVEAYTFRTSLIPLRNCPFQEFDRYAFKLLEQNRQDIHVMLRITTL